MKRSGRLAAVLTPCWVTIVTPATAAGICPGNGRRVAGSEAGAFAVPKPALVDAGGARARQPTTSVPGPRGLSNLVAFSRLLGYVRYFYPGDQAAAVDLYAFNSAITVYCQAECDLLHTLPWSVFSLTTRNLVLC